MGAAGRQEGDVTTGSAGGLIGQSLGEYRLTALLGAGGMAEVYRALDVSLNREVAVKVLPPSLANDPDYVLRFRNEARHVAALNHPNIVPVFTYGEESDLLYLVMPLLRESLRERMERERVMAPQDAIRVCIQVAAALDVAHSQGIVHRDVKPENILLDDDGRALLTDFGIAREASALRQPNTMRTLAGTGLPVGTVEYMAPEQRPGGPPRGRVRAGRRVVRDAGRHAAAHRRHALQSRRHGADRASNPAFHP